MIIIVGFLGATVALYPFYNEKRTRNAYYLFLLAVLVFLTAFRSYDFYTDTIGYYGFYQNYAEKPLSELFNSIFTGEGRDPFYHFVASFFAHLGFGFRAWLVIISLIYYGGFICFIKRFDDLPIVTLFGMFGLAYVFFSMTGIRQTIAMGFCFFAFIKAYRRQPIRFLLLVFFAYLFHSSALIFLITYVFLNRKIGWLQIILVIVPVILAVFLPNAIRAVVNFLAWDDDLAEYAEIETGLSISGYIIQIIIAVASLVIAKDYCLNDKTGRALFNMVVLGLVFQAFVINIDNIFRMSMYFSVYGLTLFSNSLTRIKDGRFRALIEVAACIAFVIYMVVGGRFEGFTMFGGV